MCVCVRAILRVCVNKKKALTYVQFPCSILIKVCVLLRNRFQEIRDVARGTLVKITQTLGVRYLQYLLKEMQSILVKGYQVGAQPPHARMLFPYLTYAVIGS